MILALDAVQQTTDGTPAAPHAAPRMKCDMSSALDAAYKMKGGT